MKSTTPHTLPHTAGAEPGTPPDDNHTAVFDVPALVERVAKLEKQLKALQNATAHITSIPSIG